MTDQVSRAEFAGFKTELTTKLDTMQALMGRMVDAMQRMAIIDERQQTQTDTSKRILERLESIEDRQHRADIEAARAGDTGSRIQALEAAFKEMHNERVEEKGKQDGMVKMVKWMWVGVPGVMAGITWLAKNNFFLGA
jgi:hypothetical protein